ncbi:MAG: hypothetical protein E4H01_05265 [Lysobacterales bacterium]|nr:MAG: hypothetical protein E4H01_05265 [Xanthomonadales bacterium]
MLTQGFETKSVRVERFLMLQVFAPREDVDRIMEHVCGIVPLVQGHYDHNAFESAPGFEHYRPLEGSAAGPETEVRKRPGIVEVSFEMPDDQALIERVIETIFQVHSYQEPTIKIQEVFASRSKGLDDKDNPYRWWNTTGDWKKKEAIG